MSLNQQQFKELYDKYAKRLVSSMLATVRNREAAEDITAVAFAAAFKNLPRFRGESSFYTWVHAIALNEARRWRGKNKGVTLEPIDGPNGIGLTDHEDLSPRLDRSEMAAKVQRVLRGMPTRYRKTLADYFLSGDSVRRIARRERVPVGTVLSRMFTAKRIPARAMGGLR